MTLRMRCRCGKVLAIPQRAAGRTLTCPGCARPFRISPAAFEKAIAAKSQQPTGSGGAALQRGSSAGTQPAISETPQPVELDDLVTPLPLNASARPNSAGMTEEDPGLGDPFVLRLVEDAAAQPAAEIDEQPQRMPGTDGPSGLGPLSDGPPCPSCGQQLPRMAKICVKCGIDVKSGRSLMMSADDHLDTVYPVAERLIWVISWVIPLGIYPVASEAFGTRKPHVIRAVALVTILTTVWFWTYEWSGSPKMQSLKNLLLWSGNGRPDPQLLLAGYYLSSYGDTEAFSARLAVLARRREAEIKAKAEAEIREATGGSDAAPDVETAESEVEDEDEIAVVPSVLWNGRVGFNGAVVDDDMVVRAHESLSPDQRCTGEFHAYQLLTNAFLHGGILHIAGNLLFLIVFGSRVNALIGNAWSAAVYPLLAIAGSVGHAISMSGRAPQAALGASGAIMGLAGMYLVLFPVHKMHMAAWFRLGLIGMFRLSLKLFAVRGVFVVLFYIAFDVFFTALGIDDHVAHWAHLGGFLAGVAIALVLVVARQVNARGNDLLSVTLGRRAWSLVGRPRS